MTAAVLPRVMADDLTAPAGRPRHRAPAGAPPEIVLDLSRLVSRTLHSSPTGVDRVEMAYARTLMRRAHHRLSFSAVHPIGVYGRLSASEVERFLDRTEARWEHDGGAERHRQRYAIALRTCLALRPRPVPSLRGSRVLVQPSPNHLDRRGVIDSKLRREGARYVALVHDLIPITHPEYARPDGAQAHLRRIDTLISCADGLIANSQATAAALLSYAGTALAHRPVRVAPLSPGAMAVGGAGAMLPGEDYFVCVGTIEPRKNHLLLLNLWRALIAERGADRTPALVIVGRRGWENENIVDMLDRCSGLGGRVREFGRMPDAALRALLRDARALLMPSFAEGFGLPVAEALAMGVPVLASDIAAHREAGGDAPDYLDPLDGAAWRAAILAYAEPRHRRRTAQLARIAAWTPANWDAHIDVVLDLADEVAAC